jgi:hypothetical protein
MCDDVAFNDMNEYTLRNGGLSRRELGRLTLAAGLVFALPRAANAMDTTESEVEIKTPDGTTDAYFVHPASGKHPGVLIWPDIFGLRPAFRQMGKRLAEAGHSVLVVNPFYRTKKAPTAPREAGFRRPGDARDADGPQEHARSGNRGKRTRKRSSHGSTPSLPSIRSGKSVRQAIAWVARLYSRRRRRWPTASVPEPHSTAVAS